MKIVARRILKNPGSYTRTNTVCRTKFSFKARPSITFLLFTWTTEKIIAHPSNKTPVNSAQIVTTNKESMQETNHRLNI